MTWRMSFCTVKNNMNRVGSPAFFCFKSEPLQLFSIPALQFRTLTEIPSCQRRPRGHLVERLNSIIGRLMIDVVRTCFHLIWKKVDQPCLADLQKRPTEVRFSSFGRWPETWASHGFCQALGIFVFFDRCFDRTTSTRNSLTNPDFLPMGGQAASPPQEGDLGIFRWPADGHIAWLMELSMSESVWTTPFHLKVFPNLSHPFFHIFSSFLHPVFIFPAGTGSIHFKLPGLSTGRSGQKLQLVFQPCLISSKLLVGYFKKTRWNWWIQATACWSINSWFIYKQLGLSTNSLGVRCLTPEFHLVGCRRWLDSRRWPTRAGRWSKVHWHLRRGIWKKKDEQQENKRHESAIFGFSFFFFSVFDVGETSFSD